MKGNNKPLAEKLERMPTYHDPDGPPFEEVEETSGPNSQGSTPANNSAAGKGDAGGSAAGRSSARASGLVPVLVLLVIVLRLLQLLVDGLVTLVLPWLPRFSGQ